MFRGFALFTCLLLLSISCIAIATLQDDPSRPDSSNISANGCVERGVEAGCLVLTDTTSHEVYNLAFDSKDKPEPGMAISFQGTVLKTPTICMQGKVVRVRKWYKLARPCPASH